MTGQDLRVGRTNDRVLLAELDSTIQAEDRYFQSESGDSSHAVDELLGRMRLETILSQEIVVTDAQLLDGRNLVGLTLAKGGLLRLRRQADSPIPLVLRAREGTVPSSLAKMYSAANGFLPSLFEDGDNIRNALIKLLKNRDGTVLRKREMKSLLQDAGVDVPTVDRALSAWREIDRLCKKGHLRLETWPKSRPFDDMLTLSDVASPWHPFIEGLLPNLDDISPPPPEVMTGKDRSPVYGFLQQLRASSSESNRWAADRIQHWFDERYRRAISFQHQADYRGSNSGLTGEFLIADTRRHDSKEGTFVEIHLPEQFLQYLGDLSDIAWQNMVSSNTRRLHAWWNYGHVASLEETLNYFNADFRQGGTYSSTSVLAKTFGFTSGELIDLLPTPVKQIARVAVLVSQEDRDNGRLIVQATDYYDDVENHEVEART